MKLKIPHSHLKLNGDAIYFCWYNHKLVLFHKIHTSDASRLIISPNIFTYQEAPLVQMQASYLVWILTLGGRQEDWIFFCKKYIWSYSNGTLQKTKKRKKKKQGKKKETLHETIEQNFKKTKSSVVVVIY